MAHNLAICPPEFMSRPELQEAVNTAHFLLLLDAARQYGLITDAPDVNAFRCEEILLEGRNRGVLPQDSPAV